MLLSVPRPLSISCTMRGTTTAGDTEHRAHDRRLHARDAKEARREQHIADDLARCGQARHQDCRTADLFEVAQIERQSRLEQDNNERELAQVG